jgi:hypothetical protein
MDDEALTVGAQRQRHWLARRRAAWRSGSSFVIRFSFRLGPTQSFARLPAGNGPSDEEQPG